MSFRPFERYALLPVYLAFILDGFGLAMIYPVLTPLFLLPTSSGFFVQELAFPRTVLLGLSIAAFSLAQFFGAPLLGDFSDRIGRKRAFLITIGGTSIGYCATAIGVWCSSLLLLFVGRLWSGFFAGNLTICLAAIADASPEIRQRTRNFSRLATLGGCSFIGGILVGGITSGLHSLGPFYASTPFWLVATVSIVNLCLLCLLFPETHLPSGRTTWSFWQGVHHLSSAFRHKQIRYLCISYFFFMMCWVASMQFFPTLLISAFAAEPRTIQLAFVGVGVIWAVMNGYVVKVLSRKVVPLTVVLCCLPLLGLLLLVIAGQTSMMATIALFCTATGCSAISWTNIHACVSLQAGPDAQGRILGMNQSLGALASLFAAAGGGWLAGIQAHLVYVYTALSCFTAFALLFLQKRYIVRNRKKLNL